MVEGREREREGGSAGRKEAKPTFLGGWEDKVVLFRACYAADATEGSLEGYRHTRGRRERGRRLSRTLFTQKKEEKARKIDGKAKLTRREVGGGERCSHPASHLPPINHLASLIFSRYGTQLRIVKLVC